MILNMPDRCKFPLKNASHLLPRLLSILLVYFNASVPTAGSPLAEGSLSRNKRNILLSPTQIWSSPFIPYEFAKDHFDAKQRDRFHETISEIQNHTCIRFVRRSSETDYLVIQKGKNCLSFVGKMGGAQTITMADNCIAHKGSTLHELFHALGFYHEMQRPDRDKFVNILWENVDPEWKRAFEVKPQKQVTTLGQPFDFESIMMYPGDAFTKNNKPTIQAKPKYLGKQLRYPNWPTASDFYKLNRLYQCDKVKKSCPQAFVAFDTDCYLIIEEPLGFAEAEAACKQRNASLASFQSAPDLVRLVTSDWWNRDVVSRHYIPGSKLFYRIGLMELNRSELVWSVGTNASFLNLGEQSQDLSHFDEPSLCGQMDKDGFWYMDSCSHKLHSICKIKGSRPPFVPFFRGFFGRCNSFVQQASAAQRQNVLLTKDPQTCAQVCVNYAACKGFHYNIQAKICYTESDVCDYTTDISTDKAEDLRFLYYVKDY